MTFYTKESIRRWKVPVKGTEDKGYKRGDSPKLFYTPEEFESDMAIVELYFDNFSMTDIPHFFQENDEPTKSSMAVFKIRYKRVRFVNFRYDHVYVMDGMEEQFKDWYLPNSSNNQREKYNDGW